MKIEFGTLYKRKDNCYRNEESYGIWIPFFFNGNYFMVDTYQVNPPDFGSDGNKGLGERLSFLIDAKNGLGTSYGMMKGPSSYYHKNIVPLGKSDELDKGIWERYVDLKRCEMLNPNEATGYDDSDIYKGVPMWYMDCYRLNGPTGPYLRKKGATKNPNYVAFDKINKLRGRFTMVNPQMTYVSDYVKDLERLLEDPRIADGMRKRIKYALARYRVYCDAYRYYRERLDGIAMAENDGL